MRTNQLRHYANRYLNEDNRGSYRDKMYRLFVIHKVVNDLFAIGKVPPKWHALTSVHITELITFWRKRKIKPATIMKYMTVIRWFLKTIEHNLSEIDNQKLGLFRTSKSKRKTTVSLEILQNISNPIARVLLNLQINFGLTLSEAMRVVPEIHIQEEALWLTREMTSNSQDRFIPLRTEQQKILLQELIALTGQHQNLMNAQGYEAIRHAYRKALAEINLSYRQSYRYLYAQTVYQQLSPLLRNYELTLLLMREMGLQSRVTLWGYLNE